MEKDQASVEEICEIDKRYEACDMRRVVAYSSMFRESGFTPDVMIKTMKRKYIKLQHIQPI